MSSTLSPIDLFTPAADVVTRTMQPQARAMATATTLLELALAARPELHLAPQLVRQAYLTLSAPRTGDTPPIAARRATCMEIADAIGAAHNLGPRPGPGTRAPVEALAAVLPWWAAAVLLPGDDPRSAAIRATAIRESAELELAIAGPSPAAILEAARRLHTEAQGLGQEVAYLDLGLDPIAMGRDGGPRAAAALAFLRAEGFVVTLDGRNGQIVITVAPLAARGQRPVDQAAAGAHAELALEALDAMARELRQEPPALARRQALEVNLHTALERLPVEATGATVDVITAALGLSMREGAVVADVLISVKPALARACGVPTF